MRRATHIPITEKEFRKTKRSQLCLLFKQTKEARRGMAYLPPEAYEKLNEAFRLIGEAMRHCRGWWKHY